MKIRVLLFELLVTSLFSLSLQAQESPYADTPTYSEAYANSSHATHWSVYIPITALAVAAVWLGAQDGDGSSRSLEGNGCLASSSGYSSYRNRSSGSYSHSSR